ncbi:MAG: ABC transporter permease [Bacteroidetes bacterium]|nr:ABC transporter permease [Bacteroidota bacterium]MDA0888235.1 ABC transporter permease [Bacteroidota bacterium]MDA1084357.1 ABC transporter permease [Bacteroidota bacterium]
MRFTWFIARRIIGQRSHRSSVSGPIITIGIIAIALGLITMLIAIGTGVGLQQKIGEKVAAFNGHIRVTTLENSQRQETLTPLKDAQTIQTTLQQQANVSAVQSVAYVPGVILNQNAFDGIVFKGIDNSFSPEFFTFFGDSEYVSALGAQDIWISIDLAKKLALTIGDRVSLYFASEETAMPKRRSCSVAGLFTTGFSDYDNTYVLGHLDVIRSLYGWDNNQVGAFELFLNDSSDLSIQSNALYDSIDALVDVQHVEEQFPEIFNWIRLFGTNISLIIIIMIIVGGVNMITALLVLILEQTQLIGITRVIGASVRSLQQLFLIQGTYLIGVGLFWGNLIGLGLLYIQKQTGIISLDPATYYVKEVPVYMDVTTVLWLNGLTLLICLVLLILPSFIIARISPTQALKINP